jgi:hypothetical protein
MELACFSRVVSLPVVSVVSISLLLFGCSNDPPAAGGDAGPSAASDGGGIVPRPDGSGPPPGSYTLTFGPIEDVPSGHESTQCVILRLGNAEQLRVGAIHNVLGEASHHFIVYRTSDTEERTEPFDCEPFVDTLDPTKGSPLMITQRADELLELPEGVAFSFEPNQMIRLEMHYINYAPGPMDISATAEFIPIAPEEFEHEAEFLFIGNPDIDIAPRTMATVGPSFFPMPSMFDGVSFFGITGHTHQLGTNMQVWTAPSESGPDTAVYDVSSWSWDEPETVHHDPPFTIPSGGGFRFRCDYDNTTSEQVGFGESANQEMCFFWAYYYPSRGAYVCGHSDQFGGFDICCPGSPICSSLFGS